MTSTLSQRTYTVDEYLDQEITSADRHEYRNGVLVLMPGGTLNHNRIAGNLFAFLNFGLKRKPLDVFIADQRLWIADRRIYTYPDVMVVGQPVELQEGPKDTLTNPIMIAEVLSQSTRSYDKDEKFAAYRTLASFREYLLIDQYTAHVEHYTKTEDQAWLFREYDSLEATVLFQSFDFSVSLADLYDKVNFSGDEVKIEAELEDS